MNLGPFGSSRLAEDLLRLQPLNIALVGPPGSGKSEVGRLLAERLNREFVDTDVLVEQMAGMPVTRIFEEEGEAAFRKMETEACVQVAEPADRVIACGGGAIVDPDNRRLLEAGGAMVYLAAEPDVLLARLDGDGPRPLLDGGDPAERLRSLLESRQEIYEGIPTRVDTTALTAEQTADFIAELPLASRSMQLEARRPRPGYQVTVGRKLLDELTTHLELANLRRPYVLVTDSNVSALHGEFVQEILECALVTVAAGEEHKSQQSLSDLYMALLEAGMNRHGSVIALGGGVVLDLVGYAAATFMRGVSWVALPTTLLSVVDASLGGKVGINLQAGKNLVGAFHAPGLVMADLTTLSTLPLTEIGAGLAEMIKAALIGDPELFERMESGQPWITQDWVRRAILVKLAIVDEDPREGGRRAALNLGHTFAHALEATSGYTLSHGAAVSIGLVGAARLALAMGRCEESFPDRIREVLLRFGLPTSYSDLESDQILDAMSRDKKGVGGQARFVLPVRPGLVESGVEAPAHLVYETVLGLRESA